MAGDAFQKLKNSVNKGITTISVKTSSTLEKSKIQMHIESLTKELEKIYRDAGEQAYLAWKTGETSPEAISEYFGKVDEHLEAIAGLETELNSIDARDQQILGTKPEESSKAAAAAKGVVCPGCGAEYAAPVKFCRNCGRNLQENQE